MSMDHRIQSLADLDTTIAALRKRFVTAFIGVRVTFSTHGFEVNIAKGDGFQLGRGVHRDLTTAVNKAVAAAEAVEVGR